MTIAVGKFNTALLLDGFLKMAKGENEKHERNQNAVYNHPDGWGIAYLEGGRFMKYKKEMPAWEDDAFARFRSVKSDTVILHARRSSATKRAYENTQPFYRKLPGDEYVFCHNGTIREQLAFGPEFYPLGETDSERLFYYLLTSIGDRDEASLHESLLRVKDCTAANMILAETNTAYIAVQYNKNSDYYTMKLYSDSKCLVISSEILEGFSDAEWHPLKNNSLVEIKLRTFEYAIEE